MKKQANSLVKSIPQLKIADKAIKAVKAIKPAKVFMIGIGSLAALYSLKLIASYFDDPYKNIDEAIEKEIESGNQLSYNLAYYEHLCSTLHQAGEYMATDEQAMYDVFQQMNNNADIFQLIKSYGKRDSHFFGIPHSYTLSQMINEELDSSERAKVNKILEQKGVNFKF